MDATTLKGRINIALDSLKRTFPTKQIVLLTPIHRSDFHANEKNWQCDESYTNQCGEYIDAYVEAVKEAANVWAVPVIDWNAASGLFPMQHEHEQYFKGATDLLLASGANPEDEIDKVTTPGGITIRGLNEMEKEGFSWSVIAGLRASQTK